MRRCPNCRERLRGSIERLGARCPQCRAPLSPEEEPRRRRDALGACAEHPTREAVLTCGRCGRYACQTCRTRWQQRWLCVACVNRALDSREIIPGEAAAHLRGAILSLILGILGWGFTVGAFLTLAMAADSKNLVLMVVASFCLFASPIPALFGVGQGAAAIRTRGDHMVIATIGLTLSGLNVGMVVGLLTFGMSQN